MKNGTTDTSGWLSKRTNIFLDRFPTHSRLAESYRTLRANLHFAFLDRDFRSVLITSSGEKEGKTSTVANTAYTMAKAGKSVLMIDADLRRPFLSMMAPSSQSSGLTGLLSGLFGTDIREGSLKNLRFADLLRLLAMQKKTGELRLLDQEESVEVFFFQGRMVDLNWVTRPDDQRLATLLVQSGLISAEQAKQVLVHQRSTGQKLGFILISTGLLKKEQLDGILTMHMMEGLRNALQMTTGKFSFKEVREFEFTSSPYSPVDFDEVYKQVVIAEEEIAYIQDKINEAILPTSVDNLFLLPAGKLPPNPSELLSSERMAYLLSILEKKFDRIVIDTPPLLPASDALLIADHVDGVVLVVKAGAINRKMIKKAVEQLRSARASIMGVVLNQVDIKRAGYYSYYHKYYSSYYGKQAEK
ncbi:MAG: polysaccharide biosynthesis tyrosine autokinase [Desulfobacterales bacterium]|nr:polysaccharide biosynthesis tyrosine autokinase [Desulfobacterales bacterium]